MQEIYNSEVTANSLRRTPRTRHKREPLPPDEQVRQERVADFRKIAFATSVGDDAGAITNSLPKSRFLLTGHAWRSLVILLVVILGIVLINGYLRTSKEAVAIPDKPASTSGFNVENSQVPDSDPNLAGVDIPDISKSNSMGEIVVYVSGAVNLPGVVTLSVPARINDALEKAGGFTDTADKSAINLAAIIKDGQHIHIPAQGETASVSSGAEGTEKVNKKVNLNTATVAELTIIPGIGPATAAAIVKWRSEHGQFSQLKELTQIAGIGSKTVEKFREYVTL